MYTTNLHASCSHGLSRFRQRVEKRHPAHYEMGTYRPTMPPEEEEEDGYMNGNLTTSREELTELNDQNAGWNKIHDVESVEDIPTSFVNEEAIYVNSTFKGELGAKLDPQVAL